MSEKAIDKVNLAEYREENEWGLIPEVDLEYPQKLHDSQNLYISRYSLKL